MGKGALWGGRVLSGIVILMLTFSAIMKLSGAKEVVENFTNLFGYPANVILPIGLIELAIVVLYIVPKTQVLGAILITGYLGGAIATHVRVADPSFVMPFFLGVFAWGGLYLRSERLKELLPLTKAG